MNAGHRIADPHDCFLMNCHALGPELADLRERYVAVLAEQDARVRYWQDLYEASLETISRLRSALLARLREMP